MMDCQKIGNGLQVTGIGTSTLHMVGYLGKNCNFTEVPPNGCCPVCKKMGLMQHIRKYRINFEESILLCENPQCIYPLGSVPLSDTVTPFDAKGYPSQGTCGKRRVFDKSLVTSPVEPCSKLTRTDDLKDTEQTFGFDLSPKRNGSHLVSTQSGQCDLSQVKQPAFPGAAESIQQEMVLGMAAQEDSPKVLSGQTQLLSDSGIHLSVSQVLHQNKSSLREPLWLQWRNKHALCWLDCILSVLVHLETLRITLTGFLENTSVIQRLFTKYNQAAVLVNTCQREVPSDVLSRAESHLNEIRNTIFDQLQPLLKCKLGKEESPVFAFPLLLRKDHQIDKLFLHSFFWKFKCLQCGYHVRNRCQQTMTTFTNIIPEWHPLNAVHVARCNNCNHTSQRRRMVLENVSSVLMMHFVEGLPHNNMLSYSFQFQEKSYQVTAVVQYQEKANHFITWILTSDGMWLECDDLKGSYSRKHKNFCVPSAEVHIVIWERRPSQITNYPDTKLQNEGTVNVFPLTAQPKAPIHSSNDETIDDAPLSCRRAVDKLNTHSDESQKLVSNQETKLLYGLENLVDDDVGTFNLVSVPRDLGEPPEDGHSTENNRVTTRGPLQLQVFDQKDTCLLTSKGDFAQKELIVPGNRVRMYQGQPPGANNQMPSVPLSNSIINCSPEVLPLQGTESEVTLIPIKERNSFYLVNPLEKISKKCLGKTMLGMPNVLEPSRAMTANAHISAPSSQGHTCQSSSTNGVKSSGASWVNSLLGKYPSFMPKSVLVPNKDKSCKKHIQKEINSNLLSKHAGHFRGFQAKCSSKNMVAALDFPHRTVPLSFPTTSSVANIPIKNNFPNGTGEAMAKKAASLDTLTKQNQLEKSHNNNQNSTPIENTELFTEKAHQLRITLLQQLKAKKEKLASLDKLVKAKGRQRNSFKKALKDQTEYGSQKESKSLQTSLLQVQTDTEDTKSVTSSSINVSQCSSLNYDDVLSELLFSPATTVGSLEFPQDEECRYLEMGDGSSDSLLSADQAADPQVTEQDHNYYSPVKENVSEGHRNLLTIKSPLKKLNFESSAKQDILDDLFSDSMLNSVTADTDILHHFDESLLAW